MNVQMPVGTDLCPVSRVFFWLHRFHNKDDRDAANISERPKGEFDIHIAAKPVREDVLPPIRGFVRFWGALQLLV